MSRRSHVQLVLIALSGSAGMQFKNPFASKTDGATVMRLQLAFRVSGLNRGASGVLGALSTLADGADATTAEGIELLAQDTALLLLRREREWIACAGSVKHYGDDDDALRDFDRTIVSEASKFDRENPDRSGAPYGRGPSTLAVLVSALLTDHHSRAGLACPRTLWRSCRRLRAAWATARTPSAGVRVGC